MTLILIWLVASCIAAPFVGRFLAGCSDDPEASSISSHTHKIEG